jgi:hypothetical protein
VLKQGLTGVHFELGSGLAAEIDVGQYPPPRLVGARECLRAFIPKYAEVSFRRAQDEMQDCQPPREPANDREAIVHRQFKERWDEAFAAHGRQDRAGAQAALAAAVEAADQLRYEIEDVAVAPYKFDPARHEDPSVFLDLLEERVLVGGQPALRISFRLRGGDRHERWVYVLSPGANLFALHYFGNQGELATFDGLVASVSFPGSP